jgi:hypothetical protein
MTYDIDHATCSVRMRAFVAGDLDDRTAAAVTRHLESCSDCAAELRSVSLLLDAPAPLTADERSAIHSELDARTSGSVPGPASLRRSSRPRLRMAPVLAAAAVLVLLAVAAPFVLTGTVPSSEDEEAAGAGGGAAAETSGQTGRVAKEDAPLAPDASGGVRFDASGRDLSRAALRRMGRAASVTGGSSFTTSDVGETARLAEKSTSRLVREAPVDVADQVDECVETVLGQGPVVPVHGAVGTLEGREVVVVVFARATKRDGLDGYQVWAWPIGSCDAPVSFQAGRAP